MKKAIIPVFIFVAVVTCVYSMHDFNARYLEVNVTYTLKTDGTQIYDYFHRVKLLNSTRGFGESFIKYNPEFQKLEVIGSVTTMADGRKIKTPENGYNEVLPREAKRFASFSNLREMVISHTGIERGAEIELRYRIITKKGFIPYFTGKEFLTKRVPVDKYTLAIKLPENEELRYKIFNCSVKPEKKVENGIINYFFRRENIAAYRQNSYVENYDRPHIIFSNLKSSRKLFPDIFDNEDTFKKLEDTISKIKKEDISGVELLKIIKREIIDTLENCFVDLKLSGFRTRSVKNIIKSGYATSYEKVLILKKLFGRFGFKNRLVSVLPFFKTSDNLFSYLNSIGFICAVSSDGENVYIDPIEVGTDFHVKKYCDMPLIDTETGKVIASIKHDIKTDSLILNGKILLKGDKISGNMNLYTSGSYFSYSKFLKDKNSIYKNNVKKIFPVSKVKNIKILKVTSDFAEISGEIETKPLERVYGEFLFLKSFPIPKISENMVSKDQIMYPITIASPFLVEVYLSLNIQDGYIIDMIRQDAKIDNNAGIYEYSAKSEKKNHLNIYFKFGLKKGRINKENYLDLKQLVNTALGREFQVILKKK